MESRRAFLGRQLDRSPLEKRPTGSQTIFMLNDYHVNGSAQGSRIDGVPCLGHRAAQAPNVLHPSQPERNPQASSRPNR